MSHPHIGPMDDGLRSRPQQPAIRYVCGMRTEATALLALGQWLRQEAYTFVTVTPETHQRVNERAARSRARTATNLRDVFGWNRTFEPNLLPTCAIEWLRAADALEETDAGLRSRVRFSTLGDLLCVHSGFPTLESDAVFFGPDTYRFCQLLTRWAPPARRCVDIGCGSGAGALSIAGRVQELVLADLNPRALLHAEVNAALAQTVAVTVQSDILSGVAGEVDLIIANPPYLCDPKARLYRDGGAAHGTELSVRIVREGLERLSPSGTLIVYTGAPIVEGRDVFFHAVQPYLDACSGRSTYSELDPDVFGEELAMPGYADVERIAVIGLRVCRSDST